VRSEPTIMHVDLDAFFAAVEQRDKPSLRGKAVVVGGVGGRGVVATASYEARTFGVRSAMSTREARSRAPHAAYLSGRHHVYREVSETVMAELRAVSPLVEPLSMDEAFVDLEASGLQDHRTATVVEVAQRLKARIHEATGGLTGSVGIGSSKLVAKIASDLHKPDGLVVVPPGTERMVMFPMSVTTIPGVGPATTERLRRVGVQTIADLAAKGELPATLAAEEDPLGFLIHAAGGMSLIDAAYRYARHEPGIDVVLFGTSSVDHLRANIASILRPPLPTADVARLNATFAHLVGVGLDLPDRIKG